MITAVLSLLDRCRSCMPAEKATDVRVIGVELYLLPIRLRVPLKFGRETLTDVTCARAKLTVEDRRGRRASGWGETPLSVQWAWPSTLPYQDRCGFMVEYCRQHAAQLPAGGFGHPIELGSGRLGTESAPEAAMHPTPSVPLLARLVCESVFDQALHDAYGNLHGVDVYQTYSADWMNQDLSAYLEPADSNVSFAGKFPRDFLVSAPPTKLPAWHLVGGLDPIDEGDLKGDEPHDGYPVLLADWIKRDGLKCLKIKLRGTDSEWDYERIVRVGRLAIEHGALWLSVDFNCTVTDPAYVNDILDQLKADEPRIDEMVLYVEQPFPYDLRRDMIDVRSLASRKPLFLDESAHDWEHVRLGRELGWTGVALKTCKTQSGALLSLCWAKAHGMALMVQDLTNPMLAMIPHVRLAAHAGTIKGVETNAMQFYPEASRAEARVHPGLYQRRGGTLDLSTISGPGFGYRIGQIERELPEPVLKIEP
jgi:L-alanine-DL-glutamate epimerase-like enolase superfamily enzyme